MSSLPSLEEIASSPEALSQALTVLFEHSPILQSTLLPQLSSSLPPLHSYTSLIDISLSRLATWDDALRAQFIAGHPRIGESKNLSNLSSKEQGGGAAPTPPEVLARLEHLNACYEARYPGLRYITFVNGRSRALIAEEMEDRLGLAHSLSSPTEPDVSTITALSSEDPMWKRELDRAVGDVGLIARSRLTALGVN